MYIKSIPLTADSAYSTLEAVLPEDAPSGIYEAQFHSLSPAVMCTIIAFNQGNGSSRPAILQALERTNPPIIISNGNFSPNIWSYENETGGSTFALNPDDVVYRLSVFFKHVSGEETRLVRLSSNGGFTQGSDIMTVVVKQISE